MLLFQSLLIRVNSTGLVKVYPNPTTGIVNISFNTNIADKLIIYNSMGKEVVSESIGNSDSNLLIDMSKMRNGLYVYKLENNDIEISSGKLFLIK